MYYWKYFLIFVILNMETHGKQIVGYEWVW